MALAAILAVVLIASPAQVMGADAARIITGLEGEHFLRRNLDPLVLCEREAMRRARAVDVAFNEAVAVLVLARLLFPALIFAANIDLRPEHCFNLCRSSSHENYFPTSITAASGGA